MIVLKSNKFIRIKIFFPYLVIFLLLGSLMLIFISIGLFRNKALLHNQINTSIIHPIQKITPIIPSPPIKKYYVEVENNKFILEELGKIVNQFSYKPSITEENIWIDKGESFQIGQEIFFLVRPLPWGCIEANDSCKKAMEEIHDDSEIYGGIWKTNINTGQYTHVFTIPETEEAFPTVKIELNQDGIFILSIITYNTDKPGIKKTTTYYINSKTGEVSQSKE